jgi:hypothetical protein
MPPKGLSFAVLGMSRVLLVLGVAACGDLDSGPVVELRTDDPAVSLHFSRNLPTLPALAERWGTGLGLEALSNSWTDSWQLPPEVGAPMRMDLVGVGSALLADRVPPSALDRARRQIEESIEGVREWLVSPDDPGGSTLPPSISGPLAQAAGHWEGAKGARAKGDATVELRELLMASDALRSTTAGPLALAFMEQAEDELRRISESETYPVVTRQRAERLLMGAEEALEVGEPIMALQRAWYALGLLRAAKAMETFIPDNEEARNQ